MGKLDLGDKNWLHPVVTAHSPEALPASSSPPTVGFSGKPHQRLPER